MIEDLKSKILNHQSTPWPWRCLICLVSGWIKVDSVSQQELRESIEEQHKMKSPKCNPILVIPVSLLAWLFCLYASGEVVAIKYDGDGQYLLTIVNGEATVTPIKKIIDVSGTPTPPVDPPVTAPLEVLRRAVITATDKVADPNKINQKKALATLYRTTSGLPVTDRGQLVQATDIMFQALALAAWKDWKSSTDVALRGFAAIDDAKRGWLIVAEVLEKP